MYLKLSNWLHIIAFKLKQKSIYFELKYYIKNKESYLKRIHNWERCIGKTYSLLKLANKYNCPIAVPTKRYGENLNQMYYKMFKKDNLRIIVMNESSRGKRENLILCEEGITEKEFYEILKPMAKLIVGYQSLYF